MKKVIQEFKTFAMRGNMIDMAVGIIIGGAFGKIVNSLVNDIMMPPLGRLAGNMDFSNLFLAMGEGEFATLQAARDAGIPTLAYGMFINEFINFLIIAFAVFLLVKGINTLKAKEAEAPKAPPAPSAEEKLLTEIRDLLAK
jgi:large conductance mechanosensitive channel